MMYVAGNQMVTFPDAGSVPDSEQIAVGRQGFRASNFRNVAVNAVQAALGVKCYASHFHAK
jgi:hypothetical protein